MGDERLEDKPKKHMASAKEARQSILNKTLAKDSIYILDVKVCNNPIPRLTQLKYLESIV